MHIKCVWASTAHFHVIGLYPFTCLFLLNIRAFCIIGHRSMFHHCTISTVNAYKLLADTRDWLLVYSIFKRTNQYERNYLYSRKERIQTPQESLIDENWGSICTPRMACCRSRPWFIETITTTDGGGEMSNCFHYFVSWIRCVSWLLSHAYMSTIALTLHAIMAFGPISYVTVCQFAHNL